MPLDRAVKCPHNIFNPTLPVPSLALLERSPISLCNNDLDAARSVESIAMFTLFVIYVVVCQLSASYSRAK